MRVLSQKELKALSVDVSVFPDEHSLWMHVWFSVPWMDQDRDGQDSAQTMFHAAVMPFQGELMTFLPVEPVMYITPHEKIVKPRAHLRNRSNDAIGVARIPTSSLVLPDELERLSITPRAGYLYLRADFSRYVARYCSGEPEWVSFWNYRNRGKRGATLAHLFFDPEICLNAKAVVEESLLKKSYAAFSRFESGVIFETPFEYPPGFIWETARALKRYFERDCPHLVEGFRQAILAPQASPNDERPVAGRHKKQSSISSSAQEAPFPYQLRDPILPKIDRTWHQSSRANLVQTILLARLIGGRFWVQALASLESMYGQEIDWAMPRA